MQITQILQDRNIQARIAGAVLWGVVLVAVLPAISLTPPLVQAAVLVAMLPLFWAIDKAARGLAEELLRSGRKLKFAAVVSVSAEYNTPNPPQASARIRVLDLEEEEPVILPRAGSESIILGEETSQSVH